MNASSLSTAAAVLLWFSSAAAAAQVTLTPHRAVYDLALDVQKNLSSEAADIRGRMVYAFTGSPCEGYKVDFRFVLESDSADGEPTVTDLRSTNFETAAGDLFRFRSETYTNGVQTDDTAGSARSAGGDLKIELAGPERREIALNGEVLFPSAHLARIIKAAEAGETLLTADTFDGSDGGDHAFHTSAVIGAQRTDEADPVEKTIGPLRRWPVVVTYFNAAETGDRTPDYAIAFDLWENGVSTRLRLDYGDFALKSRLVDFKPLPATACPAPAPAASPDAAPAPKDGAPAQP